MNLDCPPGYTFLLGGHLHVVVAESPGPPEVVIVVCLTTKKLHSDTTTVFDQDDHPFIKHESIVSYVDARIFEKRHIIRRIEQRDITPKTPFADDKLKLIQKGILESLFTSRDIKSLCAGSRE